MLVFLVKPSIHNLEEDFFNFTNYYTIFNVAKEQSKCLRRIPNTKFIDYPAQPQRNPTFYL